MSSLLAAALFVAGSVGAARADSASPPLPRLTWFGQACFLLESAAGTRVLMDPIPAGLGYRLPVDLAADVITVSHEHFDHNNTALAKKSTRVLRGLTPDKKGWRKIDEKVKDVSIRSVGVYHDEGEGAQRGLDAAFVFEVDGLRIVHLGDLGHTLSSQQLSEIGSVDVALIPVGGFFTVDARQATRVLDQLRPRLVVVPMHYKTAASTVKELAPIEDFLAGKRYVRREAGAVLRLARLQKKPTAEVVVLNVAP